MQVTGIPVPGELRKASQFVLKLNFLNDATIDLLFSKVIILCLVSVSLPSQKST